MAAQSNHHSFGSRQATRQCLTENNQLHVNSVVTGPRIRPLCLNGSQTMVGGGYIKKGDKQKKRMAFVRYFTVFHPFALRPMSHLSQVLVRRFIGGRTYIYRLISCRDESSSGKSLLINGRRKTVKMRHLFLLLLLKRRAVLAYVLHLLAPFV